MNTIIIQGHLGADPETRFTPQGRKVTNFRMAVNVWQNGKEATIWYQVAIWGESYDNIIPHLKKGSAVTVTGNLREPSIWTDANGVNHIRLEVDAHHVQFPRIGKNQQQQQGAPLQAQNKPYGQPAQGQGAYEFSGPSQQGAPEMASHPAAEDDLPF